VLGRRRRLTLVSLPGLALVGAVFFFAFGLPWLQAHQARAAVAQPIDFDHSVHTQQAGLDCLFCHRSVVASSVAGVPSIEQCMACHQVVSTDGRQPEIEKVRQAWQKQQPIEWVRVHRMPDHVIFTHEAHVRAGVSCLACHGDVGSMQRVTQVRPLSMADCVNCHTATRAPVECIVCHR
jgi:hypothetical protein